MPVHQFVIIGLAVLLATQVPALPPAYQKLATAISTPYTTTAPGRSEGTKVQPFPITTIAPDGEKLFQAMQEPKRGKHAMIVAGLARLQIGVERVNAAKKNIEAKLKAADDKVDDVERRASAGEYIRPGKGEPGMRNGEADDGTFMVQLAIASRNYFYETAPKDLGTATSQAMEQARLEAWQAIIPHLNDVYPSNKLPPAGLEMEVIKTNTFYAANRHMLAPDNKRITITNKTAAPLTNLTLIVELVSMENSTEPSALQAYFVPKLEAGKTLWLVPLSVRNLDTQKHQQQNSSLADRQGVEHFKEWLGLEELSEVRYKAWASEGKQAEKALKFPGAAAR